LAEITKRLSISARKSKIGLPLTIESEEIPNKLSEK
jgi:hypothetical protein